jgi:histidinol phosphatase-like enzyme
MSLGNKDLKWKGIDLDGVLAATTPPDYALEGSKAIKQNRDMVMAFREAGYDIIIYTARPSSDYIAIKQWLNRHKIPFKMIITGKLLLQELWDDRARNPYCSECRKTLKKM